MTQGLLILGAVLVAFGLLFVVWGRVGERGYWTQRDPEEAPGQDDTGIAEVARHLGEYAMRGKRPSLRVMAIGLILVVLGVVSALAGAVATLLG